MDAIITGIHTGLGNALALHYIHSCARVTGMSRQAPTNLHGARFVQADLLDFAAIPNKVEEALSGRKSIDLIILNAGMMGPMKDLKEYPIDEAKKVLDLNIWSNKIIIDALLARAEVTQIVGLSSGAAVLGSGGMGPYSMSKAALNLLLRAYAYEHPDTHFSAIAPGVVKTPMIEAVLGSPDEERHPGISRIRSLEGTPGMQSPKDAAARFANAIEKVRALESGGFFDVRSL